MTSIGIADKHGRVDTRVLGTFVALARTGNFTSAAAELHLAQSTVTAHIQALEKELRLRLVDRLPGGAVLTDAGRRVLDKATIVLDAEAALRGEPEETGPIEGTVRIGAPESLCGQLLPPVVAALQRRHPGVDVTLTPTGTAAAIDALRAGALSLALIIEPSVDAADLVLDRLGTLELAFVSDRREPVTARSWAELARWRWFLLEEGCAYSDEVARNLPGVRATPAGQCRGGQGLRRGRSRPWRAAELRGRRTPPRSIRRATDSGTEPAARPACPPFGR